MPTVRTALERGTCPVLVYLLYGERMLGARGWIGAIVSYIAKYVAASCQHLPLHPKSLAVLLISRSAHQGEDNPAE